jgi:hypothetical protein
MGFAFDMPSIMTLQHYRGEKKLFCSFKTFARGWQVMEELCLDSFLEGAVMEAKTCV